jgi:uncharacterized membrane protein required for colicin V production
MVFHLVLAILLTWLVLAGLVHGALVAVVSLTGGETARARIQHVRREASQ